MGQKIKHKIAFLTHGDRNIGGGEKFLVYLICKLDRKQFEPVVLYSKRNNIIGELERAGISCEVFNLDSQLTAVYRDQIKLFSINNIFFVLSMFKVIWRLYSHFKKNNIDLVFAHDNLFKLLSVPAAKLAKKKIVTVCHDQLGESAIDKLLLSYQRNFMDKIFCVSKSAAESFTKKGRPAPNTLVVYNGLEPQKWQRFKQNNESQQVVLGMVALFDKVKGHDLLFEALKRLVAKGITNFKCIIVGDGREREAIMRSAYGLEPYLEFRGYQYDVKAVMEELDILIVPSTRESFGMVAVEAMALEIPVIATRVGGLAEVVCDGVSGYLVKLGEVENLAESIHSLMRDAPLRIAMGKNGKQRVADLFDIDKNIVVYNEVMKELLSV